MSDEPTNRSTKAYACSCGGHGNQLDCAYFRMGYCSDRVSFTPKRSPVVLVVNNNRSIGATVARHLNNYERGE